MPAPRTVIVDFERSKIVFAVDASSPMTWPEITPPRRRHSQAHTTYDRSLEDANARIGAMTNDARWIDVTEAYRELAHRIFSKIGPDFSNYIDDGGRVSCRLDDLNCHMLTSGACLSRVRDLVDHLTLAEEGLVEVSEHHRRFACVSLVLDVVGPQITAFHSMTNLPGTEWVIHKEGYGSTVLGASHIDDAATPYRGNFYPTETRYYARAKIAELLAERGRSKQVELRCGPNQTK